MGAGNYPAKYSLQYGTSCGDFVVPQHQPGRERIAGTVMAITNLYSDCGSAPTVAWAYNTSSGDKVVTSVALSAAGDQVAFISTDSNSRAWLDVLRFERGQGSAYNSPAFPSASLSNGASYADCKYTTGSAPP